MLVGKWLGLVVFGSGFVAAAGLAQFLVVRVTVGYWPPQPIEGLALLAAQTTVLLTLGLLLATLISPMASGVVAVGLFGATWIAGVVGGIGDAFGNEGVARIGTVSRMLLPTDGLWRGAMHALQDPIAVAQFGGPAVEGGFPFLSKAPLTATYLGWTGVWVALLLGLAVAHVHAPRPVSRAAPVHAGTMLDGRTIDSGRDGCGAVDGRRQRDRSGDDLRPVAVGRNRVQPSQDGLRNDA